MPRPSVRGFLMAMAVASVSITGCATTIAEPLESLSTTPTTTTIAPDTPVGGTVEVLDLMHSQIGALSEIVAETGGPRAFDHLAQIELLWDRVRPAVAEAHPGLVGDFDRMLALCRLAVERRRPAEADKAYAFLTPLIAAVSAAT